MSLKEVDLSGGDSVFCINEVQLKKALSIVKDNEESGRKIRGILDTIDSSLSRNEKAALSFVLIHRLLRGTAPSVDTSDTVTADSGRGATDA